MKKKAGQGHGTSPPPSVVPAATYLSARGYAIDLDQDNHAWVAYLKAMCTVKPALNPNAPGADQAREFPVYRESSRKLYIPRSLGLSLMGVPSRDTLHEGSPVPADRLHFHGQLRPEQEYIVASFLKAAQDPRKQGGIISVGCGYGKCLAADTPVLMYWETS
jgi:hypothetical protein